LMGIPIITWYAHPKLTWILRIAHCFSNRMVASVARAYPYRPDKFIAVGQGIDTKLFSPDAGMFPEESPMILCVGRLSPVKDHPTLMKAIWLLRQAGHQNLRVIILGGPATAQDNSYVIALSQQVKQLGLNETIHFEPAVTMEQLPEWYRRCAVVVNMTPTGSGDKVVWEAMACGKPCLVANEGFKETLGNYVNSLLYVYGDAQQLAERLKWILSLSREERLEMGMYLRGRVEAMHSLDRLAQKLVNIFESTIYSKAALRRAKTNP